MWNWHEYPNTGGHELPARIQWLTPEDAELEAAAASLAVYVEWLGGPTAALFCWHHTHLDLGAHAHLIGYPADKVVASVVFQGYVPRAEPRRPGPAPRPTYRRAWSLWSFGVQVACLLVDTLEQAKGEAFHVLSGRYPGQFIDAED